MSAAVLEILRWIGATGTAALVGWIVSRRKIEGEAKQAEGAGTKSLTEAQIALQQSTLAEARQSAADAHAAAQSANAARDACHAENRRMRSDFEAFADVIEELVPLLPAGESQRKARVALRAARLAI